VSRVLGLCQRAAKVDLEALEAAVRGAALAAGAKVLEEMLAPVGVGRREEAVRCTCGRAMRSLGLRAKSVLTLLGPLRLSRSAYACPACGRTCYPGDEELDVAGTGYSPGVRRLVADFACDAPFKRVSEQLKAGAALSISRKDCERVAESVGADMAAWVASEHTGLRFTEPPPPEAPKSIETLCIEFDGTGVPMVPWEVEGRKGKQEDGRAKTREAKVGCVFTHTEVNENGRPIRDADTTSFTGAIESAAAFGERIYAEAVRRGLYQAKHVVCITDGAEWIRNIVQTHFPSAIHVIDLYHAREHLLELCRLLFDRDLKRLNRHKNVWWEALDEGCVETILKQATDLLPRDPNAAKDARREIGYFHTNKDRMRYGEYFQKGYFVGSGVIEAACKTVIGQRLKQSGMEWTSRGANAIIALRCVQRSGRFEDYWEQRVA